MKNYWDKALSFQNYLNIAQTRAQNPSPEDEYRDYYLLGLQRMKRTLKTYKPDPEQLTALKQKKISGKILIIAEPWCGDASATVPAVHCFFETAGVPVKIFLRDSDHSLIDQFLTNGSQSIPKILLLNEDFSVKNVWGPRPAYGTALLKKFKENPDSYPRETFYNDLQIYYAKNRGKDVIEELLNLI